MSTAAEILRDVGLLADGPVVWGRPSPARGPGVYLVELPAPLASAPLDLALVGKWLERLPGLLLDGEHPTSRRLLARLGEFWLPGQVVLYAGATSGSIGGRLTGLTRHVPGERRPHADGQWLHLLTGIGRTRLWWAQTDAPEEYLDAVLDAFATGVGPADRPARGGAGTILPWAVTRRPTGERKATGLTGTVAEAEAVPAPVERRVTEVAAGNADGAEERPIAGGGPRAPRAPGAIPRAPSTRARASATGGAIRSGGRSGAAGSRSGVAGSGSGVAGSSSPADSSMQTLTPAGLTRLTAEREELVTGRRPEVVARIRAARELGDLKENSDYHAAREEQSFLEGRIQAIDAILRTAVVVDAPEGATNDPRGVAAGLGSTVVLEQDGETLTLMLVGSAEANLGAGRVSIASPVGRAALGRRAGDDVVVRSPGGESSYRVLEVR